MSDANVKETARQIVERLPDDATWDDLMPRIFERQAIDRGLADSDADRVEDVQDVEVFGGR